MRKAVAIPVVVIVRVVGIERKGMETAMNGTELVKDGLVIQCPVHLQWDRIQNPPLRF